MQCRIHQPVGGLAIINYTSGSTGFSKGVMVPYRAISSNIAFALTKLSWLGPGHDTICMLPLAHMFGLSIEMLHPLSKGCHLHFLTRVRSPKIIMDQAESVIKPVGISQQLIRLIVADQPLEIEVIEALAGITDTKRRSA